MRAWLCTSLQRQFPKSHPSERQALTLHAPRGAQTSFQVAFRTDADDMQVAASAESSHLGVTIRRVGYVPVQHLNIKIPLDHLDGAEHIPGLVPDPLLPETTVHAGPYETNAFWITVGVPEDAAPGSHPVQVTLTSDQAGTVSLSAEVVVHNITLPKRRDFPVTHWFYADALCDWYKVEPFEEAFWPIAERYFANVVAHGQDTIYVPMFTPPLDGIKRPTQLLGVQPRGDRYEFDWSLARRWIRSAEKQGIERFEWTHLFSQWGVEFALRIYEGSGGGETMLWPENTPAVGSVYRNFLSQFLPEFKQFLDDENLLDRSFFHISDEPHGEQHLANYRAARELIRKLAPWMKVMDALSDVNFAREGLVDTPVPFLSSVTQFKAEGFEPWCYFCPGPRGTYFHRRLDTPLAKTAMAGWLFYKTEVRGFLHWGYNYWYKRATRNLIDPYTVTDAGAWPGWVYGDTFVVYPGENGPIDSLRWEVWAESLQDYALLQAAGVDPGDPMLSEIQDFETFPWTEDWISRARLEVLRRLEQQDCLRSTKRPNTPAPH